MIARKAAAKSTLLLLLAAGALAQPAQAQSTKKTPHDVTTPAERQRDLAREARADDADHTDVNVPRARMAVDPATTDPGFAPTWCGTETATDDSRFARTNAPRFKVVYAHAQDLPNRFADYATPIARTMHRTAQLVLASGGNKTIRLDQGTSCGPQYIDIASVRIPISSSELVSPPDRSAAQTAVFVRMHEAVRDALEPLPGRRNYAIFLDVGLPCSRGRGDLPRDSSAHVRNQANLGAARTASTSLCGLADFFDPATTLHEVLHTLGAVQFDSVHSSQNGHCWDWWDIMCYDDDGPAIPADRNRPGEHHDFAGTPDCPLTAYGSSPLDCGNDDYFNPTPGAGTYLAAHWNVYNSIFLCEPAACQLPTQPPAVNVTADLTQTRPGGAVTFSAAGSTSANGPFVEWAWDYDGQPGIDAYTDDPSLTIGFARIGRYPVAARATDLFNQQAVGTVQHRVVARPPTIESREQDTVTGAPVVLRAVATPQDFATIAQSGWDVDADGVLEGEGADHTVTYARPGTFRPRFVATDSTDQQTAITPELLVYRRATVSATPQMRRQTLLRKGVSVRVSLAHAGDATVRFRVLRAGRGLVSVVRRVRFSRDGVKSVRFKLSAADRRRVARRGGSLSVVAGVRSETPLRTADVARNAKIKVKK